MTFRARSRLIVDVLSETKEFILGPAITLVPSALLSTTAHFLLHLRLSKFREQLASSFSHCLLLDLFHTAMDELLLVHLSFDVLFQRVAKNNDWTMDHHFSASTIITTTDGNNLHGLAGDTRHSQRTALTNRDSER